MLLARTITQRFYNPTNNRLRTSSNTRNQAIVQADRVNIQRKIMAMMAEIQDVLMFKGKSLRVKMFRMMLGIYKESSNYVSRTAANVQCYNCSEKGHCARNCPKPRNDFLVADATRKEEIKELSKNIFLMARIQPVNTDSDAEPSDDSVFLSEVQTPSNSYVNPLFSKDNQAQKYPKQPKIINDTFGDDQIDSNIIFIEPNVDANSGSVEYDKNVQESY
nr:hypothetical protein [Tanacetum cinerariifolium]